EPDIPALSVHEGKIEKNSYSVPFKQLNDGGSPIAYYVVRYQMQGSNKSVGLRIGTLNVGTVTGKGRELADMMERRKVDILCVQETRWKGSKARSIGAGFKLFYYGVDSKRNGVGVVLKEEFGNVECGKEVKKPMNGLDKPGGSIPKLQPQNKMGNGVQPEVTCDKAPLTKFESEEHREAGGGSEKHGEASRGGVLGGEEQRQDQWGEARNKGEASGGSEDQAKASEGSEKQKRDKWGKHGTRRQGQRVPRNVHNRAEVPSDVHSRAAEPSDIHHRAAGPSDVHCRAAAPSDIPRRA
ncbi:hypothetical protein QTP70_018020, partial [Hemibagrus guttatus]